MDIREQLAIVDIRSHELRVAEDAAAELRRRGVIHGPVELMWAARTALGYERRRLEKMRRLLPYRQCVSVVALLPQPGGEPLVVAGTSVTGTLGLPSGGVEEGETFEGAAFRELVEETGYGGLADDRFVVPAVGEVIVDLNWPFAGHERERALVFRGYMSRFVCVILEDDTRVACPAPAGNIPKDLRLRPLAEALEIGLGCPRDTEVAMARRTAIRIAANVAYLHCLADVPARSAVGN